MHSNWLVSKWYEFLQKWVSGQTIVNLFPNYYTQSKRNALTSCYTLTINKHEVYLIENQKQTGTYTKLIKIYIQCTISNIANIVPTNLQVQLKQFSNLFQDKPSCSTVTIVEVLSAFGKNKSQKTLLPHVVKLARTFLVIRLQIPLMKGHFWRCTIEIT